MDGQSPGIIDTTKCHRVASVSRVRCRHGTKHSAAGEEKPEPRPPGALSKEPGVDSVQLCLHKAQSQEKPFCRGPHRKRED